MAAMPSAQPEIEQNMNHLFRHQSGKLVSVLTRIFGSQNLQLAEDVVQDTLLSALEQWKLKGIPKDAEAWLFIVAKNKALNLIKKQKHNISFGDPSQALLFRSGYTLETTFHELMQDELVKDDQLRMMFACCHPALSDENQITLILKTLCGFSTVEIARAFLSNEETVSKRLYRSKEIFRLNKIPLSIPTVDELKKRSDVVLKAIYLLFNEGYNSSQNNELIRKDLMEEAFLLCKLLLQNDHTQLPEVYALAALICFHSSRSKSRLSAEGELILLPQQDRRKWDQTMITQGMELMEHAAAGLYLSSYHLEAAIAFEHCVAKDFESTNWKNILSYYEWLCKIAPSPVSELNRVIVILQLHGASKALKELDLIKEKEKLSNYYLYYSLLGEINLQIGRKKEAAVFFEKASQLTQSEVEQKLLQHKIGLC